MDLGNIATEDYGNIGRTVECICRNNWRNVAIYENLEKLTADIEYVSVYVNLGKCF